jgi:hypothetical protein
MIPKQAIEKAIEGGYKIDLAWFVDLPVYAHAQIIIDPDFWQALGKALGWLNHCPANIDHKPTTNPLECPECGCSYNGAQIWKDSAHRFYDLILTGGDTEKFWDDLLQ